MINQYKFYENLQKQIKIENPWSNKKKKFQVKDALPVVVKWSAPEHLH